MFAIEDWHVTAWGAGHMFWYRIVNAYQLRLSALKDISYNRLSYL